MHNVRITLRRHVLGHAHTARFGHPADIVAPEIHQHHVLGPLLGIGQEFLFERGILLPGCTPWARSGYRPDRDHAAFQSHQDFRRSAHDMEVRHVKVEHVRRRIQCAQRTVQRQRGRAERKAHALRQHDLHDVAVEDIALGAFHRCNESLAAEFRTGLRRRNRRFRRHYDRLAQHP